MIEKRKKKIDKERIRERNKNKEEENSKKNREGKYWIRKQVKIINQENE